MRTAKAHLTELLDRMPDDASVHTLLLEVNFVASVLRGIEEAERGETISHNEVKAWLKRWRETHGRGSISGV